jgi:hypothetical protein
MSGLLFVVAPFLIGLALGTFTNVPVRLLALSNHWRCAYVTGSHSVGTGTTTTSGRAGLVIFTGALGGRCRGLLGRRLRSGALCATGLLDEMRSQTASQSRLSTLGS